MRISAKVDYAVRAMCELAAHRADVPLKAEQIASAQEIPLSFLENILVDLRRAGFVRSLRGQVGGYRMAKPATEITIADIIRAVEGPLADVRGMRPESLAFTGSATSLRDVWLATRVGLRRVLERVSVADVVAGTIPTDVAALLEDPDAFVPH
ncbi:MAG TPA: Rrf2 family transcriptional regulator [Candidatus Limnocylindrales bacterium]|nr:Rrf2 family transcriptional regulator [Candidatus Limnocylindrales bacterium]